MKLLVKGGYNNTKLILNGVELNYPGEYGGDTLTIYTNDWAVNYQIKLNGRKPFLKLIGRERAFR